MYKKIKGVITFRTKIKKNGNFKIKQKLSKHDYLGDNSCWSNSDMFSAMLYRAMKKVTGKDLLNVECLPEGVTIKSIGFLSEISIDIELYN